MGALGYGLAALLFFFSLSFGPTSTLGFIVYSYPIFVLTGSLLLGQGLPAPLVVTAIVIGLVGVALIVWSSSGVSVRPLSVLLALLAAMAYAAYFVSGERFVHRTGPLTACLWTRASAGTALVIFTFATGAARMPNSSQWPLLVSLSVLTVGAFYYLFRGLRRLGSVKVSALGTVAPLSTAALVVVILQIVPGSASPSARH